MTITRQALFLAGFVFCSLFLSVQTAHAQEIEPRSYLFVEVRDHVTGQALGDATVKVSNPDGKQLLNEKTYKEGTLHTSFHQQYDHHYDVQITKPGYLPYEQVFFSRYPSQKLVSLVDDLPTNEGGADYANIPPIKIALLKTPVTPAERRAAAVEDQKRQLLLAVKRGDAASVSKLLQGGVNANTTDAKGVPAIAWATFAGDPETIKSLLAAGASVRNKNSLARQALLIYLAEGTARGRYVRRGESSVAEKEWPALEADIVHRLIAAGADVNANDAYRGTVLNKAIVRVRYSRTPPETIKELIAAKANVNAPDEQGQMPLMLAAGSSDSELIKLLLKAGAKASINAKDKSGLTALLNAAGSYSDSSLAIVEVLIANGARVNEADEAGVTALMLVAKKASTGLIKTLLRAGANASTNVKDKQGQTALMYIANAFDQSGIALPAVRTLLAAGANVNESDANGQSALMFAAARYSNSTLSLVKLLIAAGADVNQVDATGQTALMLAAKTNSTEVVKALLKGGATASINAKDKNNGTALLGTLTQLSYAPAATIAALLAAGANVDDANAEGQTPLILAAQRNNLAVIKMLLEAHASINVRDKSGRTALMYIRPDGINPTSEIVQILLAAGAAVTNPDENGETPLMIAAGKEYNLPIVQALLETDAKVSIDAKDRSGMTALMHATCYAPDMVKALLAAGANVNEADRSGRTALMCAAEQWRDSALESVKTLIAAGANVNATDAKGRNVLLHMAKDRNSSPAMLKTLIAAGANFNLADEAGQTPLMYVAEWNTVEVLQVMIDAGASLEARDKKGNTALIYSLSGNYQVAPPMVKALIAAGVNINAADNSGMTPLMLAARGESAEVIKALLEAGAAVNAKDNQGQTALMLAASEYKYRDPTADVVNALIAAKADVNAINQYGQTALMLAAKTGYTNAVQLLLAAGAAVNAKDNLGQTALLFAADESRNATFNVIELLIAAKASVNDINKREQTALMLAAIRGGFESVTMLLKAGAAINVKDNEGLTPLMYAAWGGRAPAFDIVTALMKAGAKVNDVSQDGETALMLAARHSSPDVLQALLAAHASVNARTKKGQTPLMYVIEGYNDRKAESVKLLLKSGADVSIKDNKGQTALTMARKLGQEAIVKLLEEAQHRP